MKNMKKVLACVLALTLLLSMFSFSASASIFTDVEDDASYAEAVNILAALDLLKGYTDGTFGPDREITRAEFTAVVVRALGMESAASQGNTQFSDVPATHYASGYINVATGQKLIVGYGDGTFGPDNNVKYEEAVKLVVAALGYSPLAESKGGYPSGYLAQAAQKQLLDGVDGTIGQNATRATVSQLLYNALDKTLMQQTVTNGVPTYSEKKGSSLLKDYLGVTKIEDGIVTSNDYDRVAKASEKKVQIYNNDTNKTEGYYIGASAAADFLGQNVVTYVKTSSGRDTVVAIAARTGQNNVLTLTDMDQIDGRVKQGETYTNVFQYYNNRESDPSSKKLNLASNYTVFYNGGTITRGDSKVNALKPASGQLTFIDNNNDNFYDYVLVEESRDIIVSVVGTNGRISDRRNSTGITLDEESTTSQFTLTMDGVAIKPADLQKNDILTVYETSDKNTVKVIATRDSYVEGKITSKGYDSVKGTNYEIDGKTYYLSMSYSAINPSLSVGDEGVFYLNPTGQIVYKDISSSTPKNYAFMLNAAYGGQFPDEGNIVSLKKADGTKVNYNLNDNCKLIIPGQADMTLKSTDKIDNYVNKLIGRVITYKYNATSNKVTEIAVQQAEGQQPSGNPQTTSNLKYDSSVGFLGQYQVSQDATIFNVKEIKAAGVKYDEDEVTISKGSSLTNAKRYDAACFTNSNNMVVAMLAISSESTIAVNANPFIITSYGDTKSQDGTDVAKIYGRYTVDNQTTSQTQEFIASPDLEVYVVNDYTPGATIEDKGTFLTDKLDGSAASAALKAPGAVITFSLDANGEIERADIIYKADSALSLTAGKFYNGYVGKAPTDINADNTSYMIGEVYEKMENVIRVGAIGQDPATPTAIDLTTFAVLNSIRVSSYQYSSGRIVTSFTLADVLAHQYVANGDSEPGTIVLVKFVNNYATDVIAIGNNTTTR